MKMTEAPHASLSCNEKSGSHGLHAPGKSTIILWKNMDKKTNSTHLGVVECTFMWCQYMYRVWPVVGRHCHLFSLYVFHNFRISQCSFFYKIIVIIFLFRNAICKQNKVDYIMCLSIAFDSYVRCKILETFSCL